MTLTVDLILSIVAALVLGGWIGWHFGRAEGKHEGICFERNLRINRERVKALAAVKPQPDIRAKTGPLVPLPSMRNLRRTEQPALARRRMVTSAADIAPVFWPQPGTCVPLRPQPGRTSITDTGELRLRAQAFIDKMAADDVEWRAKTGLLT